MSRAGSGGNGGNGIVDVSMPGVVGLASCCWTDYSAPGHLRSCTASLLLTTYLRMFGGRFLDSDTREMLRCCYPAVVAQETAYIACDANGSRLTHAMEEAVLL